MKKFLFLYVFCSFLIADSLRVSDFTVDVYSKATPNQTKKINLSMELIGTDLSENEAYVLDALNIIIGSFYAEDLLTSLGKEKFKEAFIKYAAKKHSVEIDNALILALRVINTLELDEIISAIKTKNLCSDTASLDDSAKGKRQNEIIISPDLNKVNQQPIDLNSIGSFGTDFGER